MQTFLPYKDFNKSAKALDNKRLGKQRVEVKQILNALDGQSKGWTNHPATKMWAGYREALANYGIAICNEWRSRGYNDSLLPEFAVRKQSYIVMGEINKPAWLGDERLHTSHQSNLIRKDPIFYIPVFGEIPDDLPYVWFNPDGTIKELGE